MTLKINGRTVALAELAPGACGRLQLAASARVSRRLVELGLVPGTQVSVVRRGPLGDPIELELRGYRLCVRRVDLAGLEVALEESPQQ
jgi:Fe2+ transport system protein FeoA